ncbi:MAG: hypothetical protein LAT66_00450 [Alkalimonas sp.]|nr:hypothetical protein [Alkalimonas sp.]
MHRVLMCSGGKPTDFPTPFSFSRYPPETVMQNLAKQMQQLHELYPEMQQRFSFTQQPDGSMVNQRGERMEDIAQPRPLHFNASLDPMLADCNTALSYLSREICEGYLNRWIGAIDAKHDVSLEQWPFLEIEATVELTNLQQLLSNRTEPSDLVFRFVDGSTLVLTITPLRQPGAPRIVLNTDASQTSQGESFAEYQANHTQPSGVRMSGAELSGIYHYAACRDQEVLVGRSNEYLVTTVYHSDGTITITSVQLMSSTPITETTQTCDTTGVPAPSI